MKSEQILEALDAVDDRWLQDAKPESTGFGSKRNRLRTFAIAAAAAVILLFSGFTVYRVGLVNGWWQRPSNDPLAVVQSAVEGEITGGDRRGRDRPLEGESQGQRAGPFLRLERRLHRASLPGRPRRLYRPIRPHEDLAEGRTPGAALFSPAEPGDESLGGL